MAFNRENRSDAPFRKRGGFHRKRKVCVFITGTCATHQRALTSAIKRARHMALMPYSER